VSDGIPHLAERLNALFARVPRPGGSHPYSNDLAAEALRDRSISVTGVYLSQLRSGRRDNPSAKLLAGIAELFGVPITYFFDDEQAQRIEAQLDALAGLRASGVQGIMARASDVSEGNQKALAAILEQILRIEGIEGSDETDQDRQE